MTRPDSLLFVCQNRRPPDAKECCAGHGSEAFLAKVKSLLKEHNLKRTLRAVGTTCLGPCTDGPWAMVHPQGKWLQGFSEEDAEDIVFKLMRDGECLPHLEASGVEDD